MVGLLEIALADFHDIVEIPGDLGQELLSNNAFSREQPMERILTVAGGFGKNTQFLYIRLLVISKGCY